MLSKEEKEREKQLKRLIYMRSQLILECKKEIKQYHKELDSLGKAKVKKNEL